MSAMSPYEKMSFTEATSILLYFFHSKPAMFTSLAEDLLMYKDTPYKAIAPAWYENYKLDLAENKKQK